MLASSHIFIPTPLETLCEFVCFRSLSPQSAEELPSAHTDPCQPPAIARTAPPSPRSPLTYTPKRALIACSIYTLSLHRYSHVLPLPTPSIIRLRGCPSTNVPHSALAVNRPRLVVDQASHKLHSIQKHTTTTTYKDGLHISCSRAAVSPAQADAERQEHIRHKLWSGRQQCLRVGSHVDDR